MIRLATLFTAMACSGIVCAADRSASFGVGIDYSTGRYGSDMNTQILSAPVSARLKRGNWRFRASLPWLRVSGDPNVLPTLGLVDNLNPLGRGRAGSLIGAPGSAEPAQRGTASGVGDLTLGATYSVPTGRKLGIDVGVSAKLAIADEDKGLGTGRNDYGANVDVYREFKGTTVFGGIGHTRLGKSTNIDADSVNSGNLGASHRVGSGSIGAMYQHRTAATNSLDARRDVVGFFNFPTTSERKVQLYASHGLSDSSPDWGVGFAISSGD